MQREDGYGYLHFLNLCAERANDIQRENELKVFTNMCKSLDFDQVVRCKDCKRMRDWTADELADSYDKEELADGLCTFFRIGTYNDFFCAWGEKDAMRNVQ